MNEPVLGVANTADPVVEAVPVDIPSRWFERHPPRRLLIRYESGRVAVVEAVYPGPVWLELASVDRCA